MKKVLLTESEYRKVCNILNEEINVKTPYTTYGMFASKYINPLYKKYCNEYKESVILALSRFVDTFVIRYANSKDYKKYINPTSLQKQRIYSIEELENGLNLEIKGAFEAFIPFNIKDDFVIYDFLSNKKTIGSLEDCNKYMAAIKDCKMAYIERYGEIVESRSFHNIGRKLNERHQKDYFNDISIEYELYEDSYEEGELGHVNSWDDSCHKTFGSFKELIDNIEEIIDFPYGYKFDVKDLSVRYKEENDGSFYLQTNVLVKVNNDYYETMETPTPNEIKSWKMGKKKLYNLFINARVKSNFEANELEEECDKLNIEFDSMA